VFISLDGLQYKKLSPQLLQKKYGEFFLGEIKNLISFGSVTNVFERFQTKICTHKNPRNK
jgi:hypothetical protein